MVNASNTDSVPLVEELRARLDVLDVFSRLSRLPHCVFLDSALRQSRLGCYSFIAADPFDFMAIPADGTDALGELQRRIDPFCAARVEGLPPLQGGAIGLLAYELAHSLERIPNSRWDEFQVPTLAIGLYDVVVAFDHRHSQAWLISQGFPETQPSRRRSRAEGRLRMFHDLICQNQEPPPEARRVGNRFLKPNSLAPQFNVAGPDGLTSSFSAEAYQDAVRHAVDYIYAGDVFQVNLSQRLLFPDRDDPVELYRRMRDRNPATFAAYFDMGEFQILSASPERFISVRDGKVEARPIKGTRQRTARPEADLYAASELQQSEKDRAENVMIVDLLRNDIARACLPESVVVSQLCDVEVYQFVQHLVSSVEGELRGEATIFDLIRHAFPGGSITGAPKVRAMEIISELEPTARGAYCGSLGYIGFDRTMDLNILIRTITAGRGWLQMPVGGGIVAQSDPRIEYEETWHKAEGLVRSLIR